VGSLAPSPYLAPVFGLGSHIVLDVLPHFDFESMRVEILFSLLLVIVLILAGVCNLPVTLGIIFAILPDLENLLWKLGVLRDDQKRFPGHTGPIPHGREAGYVNLFLQFIFSAAAVWLVIGRNG